MIHRSLSITIEWQIKSLAENKPLHLVVGKSTLTTEYDPHKEMFMFEEKNSFRPVYPVILSEGFLMFAVIKTDQTAWSILGMLAFTLGDFHSLSLWARNKGKCLWTAFSPERQYHLILMLGSKPWLLIRTPEELVKIPMERAHPRPITSRALGTRPGSNSF